MSTKEVTVSRAEADDPLESLKADLEAQYAAALEEASGVTHTPPGFGVWNVWAFGPFRNCVEPEAWPDSSGESAGPCSHSRGYGSRDVCERDRVCRGLPTQHLHL